MDSELKLTAEYIKNITTIEARAKDERNGVAKLELFYKDKLLEDKTIKNPKDLEKWEVSGIGIGKYTVRATSNTGVWKERVIYVDNVSDKLTPPVISLNPPSPNGENDWYKTEVQVAITTDSPSAKEIRYRIVSGLATTPEEGAKYEGPITINTNGLVTISAWTTDGTYKSDPDKCKETFYIDTTKPSLTYPPRIIASKEPVNNWYRSGLEIEISGEDEHSKIAGYRYKINGESGNWIDRKISQKLSIGASEREGVTKIAIKTFDNAGNESKVKTITIQKDTEAPDTAKIEFKSNTANSITVSAIGNDNISGIESYIFEYKKSTDRTWQKLTNAEVKTELSKIDYTYEGIQAGEYILRVTVKDNANNETISQVITATTVLNTKPKNLTTNAPEASRTTNSLIITANATDDEQETLYYDLYWNGSNSVTETKQGERGKTVIFTTKSGLAQAKNYSWRVVVRDNNGGEVSQSNSAYTNCSGTTKTCSDGNERHQCYDCNGTTKYTDRSVYCMGPYNFTNFSVTGPTTSRSMPCGYCSTATTNYYTTGMIPCTKCLFERNPGQPACSEAHFRNWVETSLSDSSRHYKVISCPYCTDGVVPEKSCGHGFYKEHSFCEHNDSGNEHVI